MSSKENSTYSIGIRQENFKSFESRTPVTPSDIVDLLKFQHKGLLNIYVEKTRVKETTVNPTYIDDKGNANAGANVILLPRCFPDEDFAKAGAILVDEFPSNCKVILGVKEIPCRNYYDGTNRRQIVMKNGFDENKAYVFFSHTFKGQPDSENMFMEVIRKQCTLVDYEMIVENTSEYKYTKARELLKFGNAPAASKDREFNFTRTVYFGKFAGIVGAINALWVLGLRLKSEGIETPFLNVCQAKDYREESASNYLDIGDHHRNINDYEKAKISLKAVADNLKSFDAPSNCPPFIVGITGKSFSKSQKNHSLILGHSATGAKEIVDLFSPRIIEPEELLSPNFRPEKNKMYVVFFDRNHTSNRIFEKYLPNLTILLNCLTWEPGNDRLVTSMFLKYLYTNNMQKWHRVISDVSCDPGGSIEMSKDIYSTTPYYIYDPFKDNHKHQNWQTHFDDLFRTTCRYSCEGNGTVITSITNLPCELPKESSREFSYMLKDYVLDLAKLADAPTTFKEFYERFDIARPIKRATMIYKGRVTPDYSYLVDKYRQLEEYSKKNNCIWNK
jgi:saccharopine dehydrogenase (NAD+, L-lysine forming)